MRKTLLISIMLAVFALGFIFVGAHPGKNPRKNLPTAAAMVTLRIPRIEIPANIVSVDVMVRHQRAIWKNSIIAAMLEVDTAQLSVRLPAGLWEMSVRGKERGGIVGYAGLYRVRIGEGEQRTATVRFNQLADQTGKPELGLEWGSEPRLWKMSLNNPVMQLDESGNTSKPNHIISPTVLRRDHGFIMWYAEGYQEYLSGIDSMWTACAISPNGEQWKPLGPIRFENTRPSWAPKALLFMGVLFENGKYRAWFVGHKEHLVSTGIGYAESVDGLVWRVSEEAVIVPTKEKPQISEISVFKHAGTYYLFHSVYENDPTSKSRDIWLLTSSDGSHWVDRGCVLRKRAGVEWQNRGIAKPAVFFYSNQFHMYYSAYSSSTAMLSRSFLGAAQSADGIHWKHSGEEPILLPKQTLLRTVSSVSYPTVDVRGDTLTMWFDVHSEEGKWWSIAKAERLLISGIE